MEPKMIDRPAFTVVGLARELTRETVEQIPQLWSEFAPQMESVPGRKGWDCYGVCIPATTGKGDESDFTYACCVETDSDSEIPEGFRRIEVPAARYAVFTFDDHISRIGQFMEKVFGEWLPATGLVRAAAPEFEHYDQRWNPQTGTGEVDYYIPVELL